MKETTYNDIGRRNFLSDSAISLAHKKLDIVKQSRTWTQLFNLELHDSTLDHHSSLQQRYSRIKVFV